MRSQNHGSCKVCGVSLFGKRPDAKFCSEYCANRRNRKTTESSRTCKNCKVEFVVEPTRSDANRRYCSRQCSRQASQKRTKTWLFNNPTAMKEHNANRTAKNPGVWREKYQAERHEILDILGAFCIVCGVNNLAWLHVDYIPTTRGKPSRHPRHPKYVREHKEDFRVLCANHHYELTLTGHIEGTEITQ